MRISHSLAHAHGQVADEGVGVGFQALVVARQRRERPPRLRKAMRGAEPSLGAERHVLDDGETVDQHEMLVHHADAERDGLLRVGDSRALAVDSDLAGIGPVIALDDAHEGGLPGAVLADDAVDRPPLHRHRHVVIGEDGAEALADTDGLEGERRAGAARRGRHGQRAV